MNRDVTVCIPTIPPRANMLARAITSVTRQTEPAKAISVVSDLNHEGAWATRNLAASAVMTTWTAFLDDDDEFYPGHLRHLLDLAEEHDAVMTWAWFEVVGGVDPFPPTHRGRQYDPADPHCVPITYLVRTDVLQEAFRKMGGFQSEDEGGRGVWEVQDQPLIDAIYDLSGGRLRASPQSSWLWHHWGRGVPGVPGNTSGMPDRWSS